MLLRLFMPGAIPVHPPHTIPADQAREPSISNGASRFSSCFPICRAIYCVSSDTIKYKNCTHAQCWRHNEQYLSAFAQFQALKSSRRALGLCSGPDSDLDGTPHPHSTHTNLLKIIVSTMKHVIFLLSCVRNADGLYFFYKSF